eukprot:GDKJ01027771.1.p1 GENE.GDKJ01027771.1~~GDKJ01027771.1.p1  ORF type:complete len:432 (-),score=88.41 GDKJ01027771.1:150-1445(-)
MSEYLSELRSLECNPFQVIGVECSASLTEVQSAYRKKALLLHPDKNKNDPNATNKFHQLRKLMTFLTDEKKRKFASEYFGKVPTAINSKQVNETIRNLREKLKKREQEVFFTSTKKSDDLERIKRENAELINIEQQRREAQIHSEQNELIAALQKVNTDSVSEESMKATQISITLNDLIPKQSYQVFLNKLQNFLNLSDFDLIDSDLGGEESNTVIWTLKDRETAILSRLTFRNLVKNVGEYEKEIWMTASNSKFSVGHIAGSVKSFELVLSSDALLAQQAANSILIEDSKDEIIMEENEQAFTNDSLVKLLQETISPLTKPADSFSKPFRNLTSDSNALAIKENALINEHGVLTLSSKSFSSLYPSSYINLADDSMELQEKQHESKEKKHIIALLGESYVSMGANRHVSESVEAFEVWVLERLAMAAGES